MTDLTKQWKKGELPEGVYYCYAGNTVETLFTWGKNYHQLTNNKDEVYIPEMDDCEIIAPVPSYDEWKTSLSIKESALETIKQQEMTINRLVSSGKQMSCDMFKLKELLKECEHMIIAYSINNNTYTKDEVKKTITKIEEVLK